MKAYKIRRKDGMYLNQVRDEDRNEWTEEGWTWVDKEEAVYYLNHHLRKKVGKTWSRKAHTYVSNPKKIMKHLKDEPVLVEYDLVPVSEESCWAHMDEWTGNILFDQIDARDILKMKREGKIKAEAPETLVKVLQ